MLLAVAWMALMSCAAAGFVWCAARDRSSAAIGVLLSAAGLQFTALGTLDLLVAAGLAAGGLALIARDLADAARVPPMCARSQSRL